MNEARCGIYTNTWGGVRRGEPFLAWRIFSAETSRKADFQTLLKPFPFF